MKLKKLKLMIQKILLQIRVLEIRLAIEKLLLLISGKKKDFEMFAKVIRKRESGNNYQIVNSYGYLGAYQFGMARLCDLGYTERISGTSGYSNKVFKWKAGYSKEYFLNNPDFQDRVFKEHARDLVKRIKREFSQYFGKQVGGIKITLSGLVAGAHLGGIGGIRNFLIKKYDSRDQFGTSVSKYIKEFLGYNLENI